MFSYLKGVASAIARASLASIYTVERTSVAKPPQTRPSVLVFRRNGGFVDSQEEQLVSVERSAYVECTTVLRTLAYSTP